MACVIRGPGGVLIRAPHLAKYDRDIVQQFLDDNVHTPCQILFDVPLPPIVEPKKQVIKTPAGQWKALKAKRIDMVIVRPTCVYVCEAKPGASAMAVGQVLMYQELYHQYYLPTVPVIMLILTDRLDPDVQMVCAKKRILYYETQT